MNRSPDVAIAPPTFFTVLFLKIVLLVCIVPRFANAPALCSAVLFSNIVSHIMRNASSLYIAPPSELARFCVNFELSICVICSSVALLQTAPP